MRVTLLFVTVRHYAKLRSEWSGSTEFRLNSTERARERESYASNGHCCIATCYWFLYIYISNVIWFQHESLRLFEFPETMNAIHSSTIRLSHNNNWWNSSEKQIFNDVVSVHGAVRVLLFYLHQLFWFYWIFICSRAHTRSTWEIHWNNNWVMRWYQCTLLLHNWENIQWNILSQWRIQSVFLFCVTFSTSFDSLNWYRFQNVSV